MSRPRAGYKLACAESSKANIMSMTKRDSPDGCGTSEDQLRDEEDADNEHE